MKKAPIRRNQHLIATLLEEWFASKEGNRNIWLDNPVGRMIHEQVKQRGNWKSAPRGDPRRGYRKMMDKMNGSDW